MRTTLRFGLCVLLLAISTGRGPAQSTGDAQAAFSGNYDSLTPEQKRLVDDWCHRFAETMKRKIDPASTYDSLPLSARTTFNAVTHALLRTPLTSEDGKPISSALSLVAHVDAVHGARPGSRGDQQFRLYAQLTPEALATLRRSKEFRRGPDNTVYHAGYPICFRSVGTPSIQFSVSRDGVLGDVDVDYRSSKFPAFLVNGHLSAANSDVRNGNNDERHNNRWTGLNNWWRSLLGLLPAEEVQPGAAASVTADAPAIRKDAKPEEAVHLLLNTWLVERKPAEVVPYFADESIACMELTRNRRIDRGMVRFSIFKGLERLNQQIGQVANVSQAIEPVKMPGDRVRPRTHPYENEFAMYDVREDLAEQLRCSNLLDPEQISAKALKSDSYGKYVGTVFRMKRGPKAGEAAALLWARQNGYWRIISYTGDPEVQIEEKLNTFAKKAAEEFPPRVDGDRNLVKAVAEFHHQWLVRRDLRKAESYISARCLPCVNNHLDDGAAPAASEEEQRQRLRAGMEQVLKAAGESGKLDHLIAAPKVSHPDIRLVKQNDLSAYVLVTLPDSLGADIRCGQEVPARAAEGELKFGNYYASGFKLYRTVGDAAVIWFVWARDSGQWKVTAFSVLAS
jgi:hypothetical protein